MKTFRTRLAPYLLAALTVAAVGGLGWAVRIHSTLGTVTFLTAFVFCGITTVTEYRRTPAEETVSAGHDVVDVPALAGKPSRILTGAPRRAITPGQGHREWPADIPPPTPAELLLLRAEARRIADVDRASIAGDGKSRLSITAGQEVAR